MSIFGLVLVLLYALLNAFLAVAGFTVEAPGRLATRILPCILFVCAAGALVWGGISQRTALVIAGLVLASIAPIVFGALVEHSNVLLHHAVRGAVAVAIGVVWVVGHQQP
ncbi:hypothetical protein [Parenemella sanctibonifatiensis]|uniref:hypothetical protein n=1 Tax=Parenemella sanctibonifatiensis TaxID=2016505 RepID=UPI0015C5F21C|nr:hypothetical protein [Parenemella sanctibonifatiensis]